VSEEERPDVRYQEQWVERLHSGHPRREQTVAELRELLLRVAFHELSRRRSQVGSVTGPEFEDLAEQAADDALMNVLRRLDDFQGRSRFTSWAYKFVMLEVSSKVARHAWRRQPPSSDDPGLERLPDRLAPGPWDRIEQREQVNALTAAVADLTSRQRRVFVAIALNGISIDVLATQLNTNRNAIYKNLFDARRSLRAKMAAAGHPVLDRDVA
jgi:RNA polymerase sigma-70 factor (ECF subfamily)